MRAVRNLLVTGGAGFIGANFVHQHLSTTRDRITVLDALTYAGNTSSLTQAQDNPRFDFVHGNICDYDLVTSLLTDRDIDTIVNFAAETHVDRSIVSPHDFIETNILGTHQLLRAARTVWIERSKYSDTHHFHHVSSDEVYGSIEPGEPPFTESAPYRPNSPYAASKAASDHLVRAYHQTYGLRATTSNSSNNYGPYQAPDKLIPLAITRILEDKAVPIYGDGSQVRDWLSVADHIDCIELILDSTASGQTYNIGSGYGCSNLEVVDKICRRIDALFLRDKSLAQRFPAAASANAGASRRLVCHVTDRLGHDNRYALDSSLCGEELGFEVRVAFDAGIERTILWYMTNHEWWRQSLS